MMDDRDRVYAMMRDWGVTPATYEPTCRWIVGFVQRHPEPLSMWGRSFRMAAAMERERRKLREQKEQKEQASADASAAE